MDPHYNPSIRGLPTNIVPDLGLTLSQASAILEFC
jgi:hypothetical protein